MECGEHNGAGGEADADIVPSSAEEGLVLVVLLSSSDSESVATAGKVLLSSAVCAAVVPAMLSTVSDLFAFRRCVRSRLWMGMI